jgi:hypothetical protein
VVANRVVVDLRAAVEAAAAAAVVADLLRNNRVPHYFSIFDNSIQKMT